MLKGWGYNQWPLRQAVKSSVSSSLPYFQSTWCSNILLHALDIFNKYSLETFVNAQLHKQMFRQKSCLLPHNISIQNHAFYMYHHYIKFSTPNSYGISIILILIWTSSPEAFSLWELPHTLWIKTAKAPWSAGAKQPARLWARSPAKPLAPTSGLSEISNCKSSVNKQHHKC